MSSTFHPTDAFGGAAGGPSPPPLRGRTGVRFVPSRASAPASAVTAQPHPTDPLVLGLVGDEALVPALREAVGPQVRLETASDLPTAASLLRAHHACLVVIDLEGLTADPVSTVERLRALLTTQAPVPPVVAIGPTALLSEVAERVEDAFDDVLVTPLRRDEAALRLGLRLRLRAAVPPAPRTSVRPKVLIVDDLPANVLLLEKYLERDYEIHVAYDGASGLAAARRVLPDLVLLDVRMPGLTGFDVCEALKRDEATCLIPVVMVTANADDRAAKIHGLETGADDFLIKPIDWPELSARVRNLIRVKALAEENRELERERERAHIMREVFFAVTSGRLELVDRAEVAHLRATGELVQTLAVRQETDIARARDAAEAALTAAGVDEDRVFDLVLCVSEAATNAVKHAGGGQFEIHRDGSMMRMWMCDQGDGIDFSVLPRSTLMKGWSTKPSLGCGFTILLEMLDKLILNTGRHGTTLAMEMSLEGVNR